MKKISSRQSRRSSVGKSSAPAGSLQYFTYEDVAPSTQPKVGSYPQHGDTVALGDAEQEAELARSRASKRVSQAGDPREHEDIFANAPEEPLAPEEPRRSRRNSARGSARGSARSSRRISRRSSMDGGLMPSSSRNSRPISPARDGPNGHGPRSRRDSASRRISRRTSDLADGYSSADPDGRHTDNEYAPELATATAVGVGSAGLVTKTRTRSSVDQKNSAPAASSAAPRDSQQQPLSQVPTAEDGLSRTQTHTSHLPSRQSTANSELGKRTSVMTNGSNKSKKSGIDRRASKPEPLKYFTYDDVVAAKAPTFSNFPHPDEATGASHATSIKGKEPARDGPSFDDEYAQDQQQPENAPHIPELPQKLAHMDLTGTGITRSSTKTGQPGRDGRRDVGPNTYASPGAGAHPERPDGTRSPGRSSYRRPQQPNLAASHGLDFSDIPGARRHPAPPPPVNLSNKPSKRPSRELRPSGPSGTTAGATAAATAAAATAATVGATAAADTVGKRGDPKPKRNSSFHEDLPEALRHGGVSNNADAAVEPAAQPAQHAAKPSATQSVLDRTRQALGLGSSTGPAPAPAAEPVDETKAEETKAEESKDNRTTTPLPLATPGTIGPSEAGFVSAPSSPSLEKANYIAPAAGVVASTHAATPLSPGRHVREERLTREVVTYDVNDPLKPVVNVEVLSKRYFMQLDDGRFAEIVEKDMPPAVVLATKPKSSAVNANDHLSSQNI